MPLDVNKNWNDNYPCSRIPGYQYHPYTPFTLAHVIVTGVLSGLCAVRTSYVVTTSGPTIAVLAASTGQDGRVNGDDLVGEQASVTFRFSMPTQLQFGLPNLCWWVRCILKQSRRTMNMCQYSIPKSNNLKVVWKMSSCGASTLEGLAAHVAPIALNKICYRSIF